MSSKNYGPVTRDQFVKMAADLTGGKAPAGDEIEVEKSGVKLSVKFNEGAGNVTIAIVSMPPFIPEAMVWNVVDNTLSPHNVKQV